MNRKLYPVIFFNLALGIRYHVDQVLRDSFTGWPFTADVTLFSLSLLFYPLALIGLILSVTGWVGPRYWSVLGFAAATSVFLAHFSPWAGETPVQLAQSVPAGGGFVAVVWLCVFFLMLIWMTVRGFQLHTESKRENRSARENSG